MSIKSDRWIRKMAKEHGMIEPFEDRQVRQGVISYGLSSYGYDIRCSDEFMIFTNINSTVVDPKSFDPKNFVEFKGKVCTVPPNSFALSRTVEYFRIPRNVLTVCLGKSTYARCFRGDTRVALVDGSSPTLEEMARRAETGELFWGYSIGENGRLIVTLLDAPRYVGRDNLIAVTLDNGRVIHCTPDHLFMLRDGRWVAADNLHPGASLMPLYRSVERGYEMVYQPLNGHLYPTHRLADEWNVRFAVYPDQPGTHRHHVDFERLNNHPWNIVRMPANEHIRLHNAENYGDDFDPKEHGLAIRAGLKRRSKDPSWVANFARVQRERALQFWSDSAYSTARDRLLEQRRHPSLATRQAHREATLPHPDNHKVVAVQPVSGEHDVYCVTVPETGNFALEAGIIVHNCGVIVNVTPFEPEWEGHVTLEISNTTPLPARIYANEGLAQVLFFESDEACEVSYKDKNGKYQGQQGITLPRL